MLNIADAQKISTGKGVTVAVIDTGVYKHPMFGDRLVNGGDYIQGDGNALRTATATARSWPASSPRTPGARRTSSSASRRTRRSWPSARPTATTSSRPDQQPDPRRGRPQDAGRGDRLRGQPAGRQGHHHVGGQLQPARGHARFGVHCGRSALQAAIRWAVDVKDKVVVAAAGNIPNGNTSDQTGQGSGAASGVPQNNNPDPNAVKQVRDPARLREQRALGGLGQPHDRQHSSFSEWGPWVSVAAPGEQIISVDPAPGATMLTSQTVQSNQVTTLQGTSFAAPYVAGLAALIRAKYPNLSARQVMYRIEATAQHPSGPRGRNNQVGYGIINPVAALTALIPGQNGVPRGDYHLDQGAGAQRR